MKTFLLVAGLLLFYCNIACSKELPLWNQLYNASCDGDIEAVQNLLERGADPNCDPYQNCALAAAANNGHIEIVKLLLKNGAKIDVPMNRKVPLGTSLLLNAISHFGENPIGVEGSRELINALLEAGADPKPADRIGQSPLLSACYHGLTDLATKFIEMGASPLIATDIGSPLGMLFSSPKLSMQYYHDEEEFIPLVKLMISKGVNPYSVSKSEQTSPVDRALKLGYYNLLITMDTEQKYSAHYEKLKRELPTLKMYSAIANSRLDLVKEYIKLGIDVNTPYTKMRHSFLGAAAMKSNPDFVKVLLEAGANPNKPGSATESVLSIAYDRPENLKLLLKAGADPNGRDPNNGRTPLLSAIRANSLEPVEVLVNNGAVVDEDVLATAYLIKTSPQITNYLLEHKSATNFRQLVHAAEFGNTEQIKQLLDKGAPVNVTDKNMVTPLIAAAKNGRLENVAFLLKAGANPKLVDKKNKNAADYAAEKSHIQILKLVDIDNKYISQIKGYTPSPNSTSIGTWINIKANMKFVLKDGGIVDDTPSASPMRWEETAEHITLYFYTASNDTSNKYLKLTKTDDNNKMNIEDGNKIILTLERLMQ